MDQENDCAHDDVLAALPIRTPKAATLPTARTPAPVTTAVLSIRRPERSS
jgi:hypothetical protein